MSFDYHLQPGRFLWNRDLVKTAEPLISIITPFYNSGACLRQTANCVLDQTFPLFEWILVDDGSTKEEDLQLLDSLAGEDPRILVLHKENGGIASARNLGIRHARTELIFPLDADDLLEPTCLEYCWWMLHKHPEAAWAYTESCGFQEQEYVWRKRFDPKEIKRENLLTATALIRKSALASVGYYLEKRQYNEDWYAWLKMIAKGYYPVQSMGEPLFWYRRTETGVLSGVRTDKAIAAENRKLIASAVNEIQQGAPAIIYPQAMQYNWASPRRTDWSRCFRAKRDKLHVMFLFPHMEMGGADKFNLDLIAGLNTERFETGILTTIPADNEWIQRFRQVTPNVFCLSNFMASRDYAEFISYYIESRKPDVLFVSNSAHGYALIPWIRQHYPDLPIVDYVHMEEWYWRNGGHARSSGAVGACLERTYVCNTVTEQVMVTHFGRKPETVCTVHIGVDEDYFSDSVQLADDLYAELGMSRDRPIVLFICRLSPQKRPFLMLEIARKTAERIPNVAFVVVGNGQQERELRSTVKRRRLENVVYFLGAKQDVRYCYKAAKITLICSLKEGLSLTAYESCAMGVPVVTADVGGQKDIIDSSIGALIPCDQTEADSLDARSFSKEEITAYADAICHLLSDASARERASRRCREKIESGFTIGHMVRFFEEELQRLAEDPELKQARLETAERLKALAPLADELYTLEMQLQCTEDSMNHVFVGYGHESIKVLLTKAYKVFERDGLWSLICKSKTWLQKHL